MVALWTFGCEAQQQVPQTSEMMPCKKCKCADPNMMLEVPDSVESLFPKEEEMSCYLIWSIDRRGTMQQLFAEKEPQNFLVKATPPESFPKHKFTTNGGKSEVQPNAFVVKAFHDGICKFIKQMITLNKGVTFTVNNYQRKLFFLHMSDEILMNPFPGNLEKFWIDLNADGQPSCPPYAPPLVALHSGAGDAVRTVKPGESFTIGDADAVAAVDVNSKSFNVSSLDKTRFVHAAQTSQGGSTSWN